MKLLVFTQKIDQDDDHFVFFLDWIREFSTYFAEVTIIALSVGVYELPPNVYVYSLGKEDGVGTLGYLRRFFKYIWQFRDRYDKVFVHMNPEYVVLGGLFWKFLRKPVFLWYVHRHVDLKLRLAVWMSRKIFSVARESFMIKTSKLILVGHGINTDKFLCPPRDFSEDQVKIVSVSRISPIKNLDILLEAVAILKNKLTKKMIVQIISAIPEESGHYEFLLKKVADLDLKENVKFVGKVSGQKINAYYCRSDFSVNLTPDGGIDKAVLESMSSGTPVLVSNRALGETLGREARALTFRFRDPADLADKMKTLLDRDKVSLGNYLRERVVSLHDYRGLIKKLSTEMQDVRN